MSLESMTGMNFSDVGSPSTAATSPDGSDASVASQKDHDEGSSQEEEDEAAEESQQDEAEEESQQDDASDCDENDVAVSVSLADNPLCL